MRAALLPDAQRRDVTVSPLPDCTLPPGLRATAGHRRDGFGA
jgi:hypothetical protein